MLCLADGWFPRFGLSPGDPEAGAGASKLHHLKQSVLADAKAQMDQGVLRHSVDAAITNLVEALDRPRLVSVDAVTP